MNDQASNEKKTPPPAKRAWQTPVMEELDLVATELSYSGYGGADLGIYTS